MKPMSERRGVLWGKESTITQDLGINAMGAGFAASLSNVRCRSTSSESSLDAQHWSTLVQFIAI
jgi:hypothetical protein